MLKLIERLIKGSALHTFAQGTDSGVPWRLQLSQDQCVQVEVGGLNGRVFTLPIESLVAQAVAMAAQAQLIIGAPLEDDNEDVRTLPDLLKDTPGGNWLAGHITIEGRQVDAVLSPSGDPLCMTHDPDIAKVLAYARNHVAGILEELQSPMTQEACATYVDGSPLTNDQEALVGRVVLRTTEMLG